MKYFVLIMIFIFTACAKESALHRGTPEAELDRCVELSKKTKYEETVECLEIVKSHYPNSSTAQQAELRIGDIYFQEKEFLLAAESYVSFIQLYPRSPQIDYAYYRAGVAYFRESPKAIDRDQQHLDDAIHNLETVVNYYPQSTYRELAGRFLSEARRRIARHHYYVGRFYYRTGEYIAALPRLREVAVNFTDSGLAPRALYLMTIANIKLKQFDEAKKVFGALSVEYPKNKWTVKAEKKLLKAVH
ncbi:MAG: outer membrane protein assembly factor BamD [Deltaproteobacteria bacterium]|nr:outer membrane protein assembly factor BamD [Deltaproteobacteria bacterium]